METGNQTGTLVNPCVLILNLVMAAGEIGNLQCAIDRMNNLVSFHCLMRKQGRRVSRLKPSC